MHADVDYADDLALFSVIILWATRLLHVLKKAASSISLYINAKKTEFMSVNCQGQVLTNSGHALKQVEQF